MARYHRSTLQALAIKTRDASTDSYRPALLASLTAIIAQQAALIEYVLVSVLETHVAIVVCTSMCVSQIVSRHPFGDCPSATVPSPSLAVDAHSQVHPYGWRRACSRLFCSAHRECGSVGHLWFASNCTYRASVRFLFCSEYPVL